MSAAALWIYLPFLTGVFLMLFSGHKRFSRILSLILAAFLSFTALRIPVNSMIVFNRSSLIFSSSTYLLGRSVTISRSDQTLVAFFYAFLFLWIFGSMFARVYRFFIPIALMSTALMIGVIAVRPFIYGIFLVMICGLLFIPMLRDTDLQNEDRIFRFLIYQMLGMICLAVSGQLTGTLDINPQDNFLLKRTAVLIFAGFSFWLAVFPFFSWIAVLLEKSCPFAGGFLICLLQFSTLFILLEFLSDHLWLRTYQPLFQGLRLAGILMFVIGSVLTLFQKNLQRMMAFIITAENGVSILLIGTNTRDGISVFLSGLFIHSIVWLIWATSVKFMSDDTDLSLESLRGFAHIHPVVCAALLLSCFTVSGMPLLAGFQMRMTLLTLCFARSQWLGWAASAASAILIFSGIRLLFVFLSPRTESETAVLPSDERVRYEVLMRRILLIVLMVLLILIGMFPSLMDIFVTGIRTQYSLIFG